MNKFHYLKCRFSLLTNQQHDVVVAADASENENEENNVIFYDAWLDELRKHCVAELKRDLQRYDLNLVLLEKKVKKLKEERESEEKPNLEGDGFGNGEPEGDEVSPVEVDLEPSIEANLPWGLKPKLEANRPSKSFISAGILEGKIRRRK